MKAMTSDDVLAMFRLDKARIGQSSRQLAERLADHIAQSHGPIRREAPSFLIEVGAHLLLESAEDDWDFGTRPPVPGWHMGAAKLGLIPESPRRRSGLHVASNLSEAPSAAPLQQWKKFNLCCAPAAPYKESASSGRLLDDRSADRTASAAAPPSRRTDRAQRTSQRLRQAEAAIELCRQCAASTYEALKISRARLATIEV